MRGGISDRMANVLLAIVIAIFLLFFLATFITFLRGGEGGGGASQEPPPPESRAEPTVIVPESRAEPTVIVPDSPAEGTVSEPPKENPRVAAFQRIERRLSRLARSNLAFNAPKQMQLGETETLKLTLSPSASVGELTQRLRAAGAKGRIVSEQQIVTAKRMRARLIGSDFEIEATSPKTQAITFAQPTDWTWDVAPTEGGENKKLYLTVTALVRVEGETTPRQIRSFNKTVTVNVTVGQRISGFVGTNWQWLWTAILIPVGVWGWKKWKDRREQRSARTPPNE